MLGTGLKQVIGRGRVKHTLLTARSESVSWIEVLHIDLGCHARHPGILGSPLLDAAILAAFAPVCEHRVSRR